MTLVQRFATSVLLTASLAAVACEDDPTPASSTESDGSAASAQDAAGRDANGATADAASVADAGNAGSVDSGAPDANSNTMNMDASTGDGATIMSDASTTDAASDAFSSSADSGDAGTFALTSPALKNVAGCSKEMPAPCAVFPDETVAYMKNAASETENISPEVTWSFVPAGTKSFALVLQDLTNGMAHWVLWNIPGSAMKLEKNVAKSSAMPATPVGSQQCNASFAGGNGYYGPGSRCNVYELVVYALSAPMFSPMPATDAAQVRTQLQALGAGILGTASLRGRANYMMMCQD